jgi:hypothetical protein
MGLFSGLGSYFGDVFGGGNKKTERGWDEQRGAYEEALRGLKDVNAESGPSEMAKIKINPALRSAQMGALGALQGEAAAGGLTAEDKAALQQTQEAQGQQERGAREAILQNATAKGAAGGGQGLAAQLSAQQGSAQRGAMTGTQIAADARKRALGAMAGAGKLGGEMEQQQFGEQSSAAQAQDLINRFNAGQRLDKAKNVAGAGQKTGDMYADQGQKKKDQNKGTWGGGGSLLDTIGSFF